MKRGIRNLWASPGLWRCATGKALIVCWILTIGGPATKAEGLRTTPPGAFDLGRAGGRIAQVDDSSAVVHNPANLVDLSAAELQLSPGLVYIQADFQSPLGQSARTTDPWKPLPNAFFGMPLGDGQFGAGLGITTPYGLGPTWDQGSSAFARPGGLWRYQAPYEAQLTTININPGVAAKFGDLLSVGVGLDVMWSDLSLKQFYPWFMLTGNMADPDGNIKAEGDGVGVGGNVGLTLQITERQRIALTYRQPLEIDYSGDFQVNNAPAILGGGRFRSDFKTSIRFPTIVSAGYGINLTDKIRVEADVEWLEFSRFKDLPLMLSNPLPGLPGSVNEQWKDTFTIGIGGDWQFAPGWVVRAGYQFYQSPVPDATFSPTIPDSDQNVLTVGLGYSNRHHSLEAAYGADFYATRNISNNQNPAFNGKWSFTVHLFSFAYRYRF